VFYRVVRMKRGKLKSAINQTQKIVNSTLHRQLKITPDDAVKQLMKGEKVKRVDYKPVTKRQNKGPKHPFKVGTLVRKVVHAREKETKLGYKRYRGKHFTKKVYTSVEWRKLILVTHFQTTEVWRGTMNLLKLELTTPWTCR